MGNIFTLPGALCHVESSVLGTLALSGHANSPFLGQVVCREETPRELSLVL